MPTEIRLGLSLEEIRQGQPKTPEELERTVGPPLYRWFGDRWYTEPVYNLWLE